MLSTIVRTVELVGAIYLAFRIGMRQGEMERKAGMEMTPMNVTKSVGISVLTGLGVSVALPITGPVGVMVLTKDVYDHRDDIRDWIKKPISEKLTGLNTPLETEEVPAVRVHVRKGPAKATVSVKAN